MTDARIDITDELMADWADGAYQAIDSRYPDGDREVALAEAVLHLVGEVRETRQRCCGHCAYMATQMGDGPVCTKLPTCGGYEFKIRPDWSCGYFQPKEPK